MSKLTYIKRKLYGAKERFRMFKERFLLNRFKRRYPPEKPIITQTKIKDTQLVVLANESIGRQLMVLKRFEPTHIRFLERVIAPDWISFDIGANIGYYTVLLSKLSPAGQVHSFEPAPLAASLLRINVQLNNIENVTVNQVALSNKRKRGKLFISYDTGFSTLIRTGPGFTPAINLTTQVIDGYATSQNINRIDFIKIDVEGAEYLVIEGAQETLERLKPKIIKVEIHKKALSLLNHSSIDILNFLTQKAYTPYVLNHGTLMLECLDKNSWNKALDIYFLHNSFIKNFPYKV